MESLEKTELIQQLETSVGAVEAGRKALETEFEEAKKSGDFSKFYELQKTVRKDVSKADRDRRILEGENPISEISAQYKNKDTKSEESAEIISLNFENELVNWTDFYNKHGLTLPANFAETMQDIWERNVSAMEKEIAEKGFDKIVFIPASVDSADLKKLEADMTKGYKEEAKKPASQRMILTGGIEAKEIINTRSGNRIILLHSAPDLTAQSELLKTLDKKYGGDKTNTVDNKAEDFINAGEQNDYISEWLILQREIWEKTGVHIDGKVGADGYVKPTWCGVSRVGKGAGSSVVHAYWSPGGARVGVDAYSPDYSGGYIGCRLSRCFE